MKERTFTDTAINIATFALLIAFVPTLFWVTREAPSLRTAHFFVFLIALYGVSAVREIRAETQLDEVELAATRFGSRWGLLGGFAVMSLLTFLPPVQSVLVEIAGALDRIQDKSMNGESRLFLIGGVTMFLLQETLRSVFAAGWKWLKR